MNCVARFSGHTLEKFEQCVDCIKIIKFERLNGFRKDEVIEKALALIEYQTVADKLVRRDYRPVM
ncbi:MAG: hypothetical protein QW291_00035 [Thermofilaceae archaeon]